MVKVGGCWTCKLRRKRCNDVQPKCGECETLRIHCEYGPKPIWMMGAERQKQRAMKLKEEIKRNTAQQRERARTREHIVAGTIDGTREFVSDMVVSSTPSSTSLDSRNRQSFPASAIETTSEKKLVASLPWGSSEHERSATLDQASGSEMNIITKYLDFFFPAVFPHYKPHVFEPGRTWLLLLLQKNQIAYHAILGLSCYFFTLALSDAGMDPTLESCKAARWDKVDEEAGKCFEGLRSALAAQALTSGKVPVTIQRKVELMASITQVMIFEMSTGQSVHWNTHFSAALALFEEVMANPGARSIYRDLRQSYFASVWLGIGDPLWTNPGICSHVWSPEQSGFRFCSGFLIFMDVLASTALNQQPRLLRYHGEVLAQPDDGLPSVGDAELRLSGIVGCSNWVIGLIAEISVLNHRRKVTQAQSERSTNEEWFNCSSRIEERLQIKIEAITLGATEQVWDHRLWAGMQSGCSETRISTLIWAHAAKLYLLTVRDGWCPSSTGVRDTVINFISLLGRVEPAELRSLAWPICVTGCLASESEHRVFLDCIERLPKIQRAGALDDARHILLEVWRLSKTRNATTWNLASCLAVLGSPLPLV